MPTRKNAAAPSAGAAAVDAHIAGFPANVQRLLRAVRATVRGAAPQAEERISYRMPALFQDGAVVYYTAFKHHIGLFPPVADPKVRARVARYAGPKGNLQFPMDQPIPHRLIATVVKARLRENAARVTAKAGKAKAAPKARPREKPKPVAKPNPASKPARARAGAALPGEAGFRRLALALAGVVERAHMGHPDFRVDNRVFASIQPARRSVGLMLTPAQQAEALRDHPEMFMPASGAWGRSGWTTADLAAASEEALGEALTLAWQNAVAKGRSRQR